MFGVPKPKVVKPMAARKTVRNPKAKGPSRQAPLGEDTSKPMCQVCDRRRADKFRAGAWVCNTCRPSDEPDPACTHSMASVFGDQLVCAFCGGVVKENP